MKVSYNGYVTGNTEQRSKVHNTVTSNTDIENSNSLDFFNFSRTRSKLGI